MTDELELLLKEEQEETETVLELLLRKAGPYAAPRPDDRAWEEAEDAEGEKKEILNGDLSYGEQDSLGEETALWRGREGMAASDGVKVGRSVRLGGNPAPAGTPEMEAAPSAVPGRSGFRGQEPEEGSVRFAALEQEGSGMDLRESNAQALYGSLMRVRRAVHVGNQHPTGGRIPLRREAPQTASGGQGILELDRAFQRDARRYDGGFTWQ